MPASFFCPKPGCGKVFARREHLTRHGQSHAAVRPHKCHICNKSFARSDILKRHIQWHTNPPDATRRTGIACENCRRRKLKCDSNEPCATCAASDLTCERRSVAVPAKTDIAEQGPPQDESDGWKQFLDETPYTLDYGSYPWTHVDMDMDMPLGPDPIDMPVAGAVAFPAQGNSEVDPLLLQGDTMEIDMEALNWLMSTPTTAKTLETQVSFPSDPMSQFQFGEPGWTAASSTAASSRTRAGSLDPNSQICSQSSNRPSSTSTSPPRRESVEGRGIVAQRENGKRAKLDSPEIQATGLITQGNGILSPTLRALWSTELASAYATAVHPSWPILDIRQVLSSDYDGLDPLVCSAMVLHVQAQPADSRKVPENFASLVFDATLTRLLHHPTSKDSFKEALAATQSAVLCLAYVMSSEELLPMQTTAATLTQALISVCRRQAFFTSPRTHDAELDLGAWSLQEQQKRVAFAALRIDAYLSILIEQPPMLRYEEMKLTLPASESVWSCLSTDDIPGLLWDEPAGRSKSTFKVLVRDALLTMGKSHRKLRLQETDYQLGLCALSPLVWEFRDSVDDMDDVKSIRILWRIDGGPSSSTRPTREAMGHHLDFFRQDVGKAVYASQSPQETRPASQPSTLTLTLYHLAQIASQCSNSFLQAACSVDLAFDSEAMTLQLSKQSRGLEEWAGTPNARAAVLHAAQLRRLCSGSSVRANDLENPFWLVALFKSSVLICAYAKHTPSCPRCGRNAGSASNEEKTGDTATLNLERSDIEAQAGLPFGRKWIESGGPATSGRLPLCSCHYSEIAESAYSVLPVMSHFRSRFSSYLSILDKQ